MQQAQQLDAEALEAVHHNEQGAADHQLPGALLAPQAAHLRVLQQINLTGNYLWRSCQSPWQVLAAAPPPGCRVLTYLNSVF